MSGLQKIIKYLAIAFAVYLIFSIITTLMYGVSSIGKFFSNDKSGEVDNLSNLEINDNALLLDIDVKSSNIMIKRGNDFKAETNSKYINSKQDNNKLYISERDHNYLNNKNIDLVIYIPEDYIFDYVSIDAGAGKVYIEELSTKKLDLDLGAGKLEAKNLLVIDDFELSGGVGDLIINDSNINNLDADLGLGKFEMISKLTGNNKIDSGVGKVDLKLVGTLEDYQISLDSGVGRASLGDLKMEDGNTYGSGINKLDINGGLGSIDIMFLEENKVGE